MSMLCPRCTAKMDCTESRRQPTGMVKRSYHCTGCGARAYSIEVITKFKGNKGKERLTDDERTARAKARAEIAVQILKSQGIEV